MTTCLLFRKIEQLIKEYPKIAEEEAENLEGKITVEEATCALKRMKNGKSPGSDGFTVELKKRRSLLEEETRQSGGESNGFDKSEMLPTHTKKALLYVYLKGTNPGNI